MTFMKGAVFLLLLAAVSISADHDNHNHNDNDCTASYETISVKDLQKVLGEWILVWSVSDHQEGWDIVGNLSSSHVKITHLPDQNILSFVEWNKMIDNTCNKWMFNMTTPAEPENVTLHVFFSDVEKDGVTETYNDTEEVMFYQTANGTMLIRWKDTKGNYVMIYNREGHRMDAEQLKEDQESYLKLVKCMKFPHDVIFTYNGAAEFCHKEPAPEAVVTEVDPEASS